MLICTAALTPEEIDEIAAYTIQKIQNYPKSFGKTVDNYFDLLFPDEVKNYLFMKAVNGQIFRKTKGGCGHMIAPAKQVSDIRELCKLMIEQQESILRLISNKLDELETDLSGTDVNTDGGHKNFKGERQNGK